MATPVSSAVWTINFRRESVTDQRMFTTTLATSVPKSVVLALAKEIRELGYVDVDVVLTVVLP